MTVRIEPDTMDVAAIAALHYHHRDRLPMWTVYAHPTDFPDGYVARLSFIAALEPMQVYHGEPARALSTPHMTAVAIFGATLSDVRRALPQGLFAFARDDDDAPHIVETWA